MGVLVETIYGNSSKTMLLPGNVTAFVPTQPLAMTMLDSLTIHAKMRYVDIMYATLFVALIIILIIIIIIIIILKFVKRRTQSYRGAKGGVNQVA